MAYSAISALISSQTPSVVKKVFIKTGSEKWQYLGQIRNGELKVTPYTTNNTMQQNLSFGSFTFEAKFEMLQTAVGELELLDSILDGSNSFLFQLADAGAIPGSSTATAGWVTVSNSQVGVKAKYQSKGDPSTSQFVEIMIKGTLKGSELDAALKASIQSSDFHLSTTASETYSNNASGVGGTIFGYYISATAGDVQGIMANMKPNGFSIVSLDDQLSTGALTAGRLEDTDLTIDWLAKEDGLGRYNTYGIDVNIEYKYLPVDSTTLLLLDTINTTNTKIVVTLLDAKVFTFSSGLGFQSSFENPGDFDKFRYLTNIHKGRFLKADFDGVVA